MTTGPRVGLSSVACDTPGGVMTSMALGTVDGSTEQVQAVGTPAPSAAGTSPGLPPSPPVHPQDPPVFA